MQGCYRNKSVFEDISRDMGRHGFKRSWLQCQRKIKSLKNKYKAIKDHNNKSGNSRATFPFFDQMEGILGVTGQAADHPELLDSFGEDDVASSVDCEEPECENINVPDEPPDTPQTTSSETSGSFSDTTSFNERASSSVSTTEVPTRASTPTPCSNQPDRSTPGAPTTRRKRKNKLESTMDVFSKTIKEALSQADDTELQLKLQAAQHAHELKMMTLFTQFLAGRPSYQPPPHPGHATGSSYYPDQVHPPRFSQDFSHPGPFTQDHTHNHTPLLPPDTPPPKTFTTLQPPPSQQGRICSKPVSSPNSNSNIPELQFSSPLPSEDD
ncbi:leucine-rich repeat extensin-like protein 5 [Cyprinus carpio]|uniref:Leucine-rich repeat extensin-like protein 5 n=1 Tax=Cyprinus carpio TaxID=7962 RepID=A0A9Q9W8V3_CYPCA|nr:leucine-rich repeat extensin-like protein 5 [Cyprinus carpio]